MDTCSIERRSSRFLSSAAALGALALLAACGGSGGPTAAPTPIGATCATSADECGQVLIAVTDADGDFVSYVVDVLSITLERAGGGSVETLPAAARVDFAELTELTELLSAATLAPGDIVGGTIRLDYASAEIHVESGGEIVPALAVDENGAPLGVVEIEIRLAEQERLVVTRGRTALLGMDFDLGASHDVDLTETPARVTARPYFVAEIHPLVAKEMRVRGGLVDVDMVESSYDIRVRPWHRRDGDFGIVTVATTAATAFDIGGQLYTGAAGLQALDGLGTGTLTVAFGTLDVTARRFTAEIVHAGDSVGGDRYAAVHGNVVARNGDLLTVKGAIAVHRDRPARFRRTVLVEVGPGTGVAKVRAASVPLDKDDISVGQRIVALGQFTNADDETADVPLLLDATTGRVRMLVTHLHGTVTGVLPGQLNMELRAIDRLGIDMFDFAGTGASPATDADPLDYEITTGTLSLAALEVGKWARVHGFAAPFGEAPPDFIARTVVDHRDIPAALGIGWGLTGTRAPFASMGPTSLVIDMGNPDIGMRHHLLLGRRLVDLFDLPMAPSIVPGAGPAVFGLASPGHIELFADFDDFVAELALSLGGGDKAQALAAYGTYDESARTVVANRAVVYLAPVQ